METKRYFQAIESYAIAQAMMLPLPKDEKIKAPNQSLIHYRMDVFNKAITEAKIDIARNYSLQGQRW
ncbi:hypothetical protein [Pasteurella atlantica]|uniref:hypothetical protein n=1 Tax=Pasteurellaceae TaxID=712 RepID=UPI00275D1BF8|nr:hypothetical protein [Pasteurella atlantica]MDP8098433.1 hypothetical protein [Pasteurella atlantica]MDP8106453.1 hypothetical protein [Pasteurella atlantica]MDP8116236.1 hypothetical protein [Pasteurella atlantica]